MIFDKNAYLFVKSMFESFTGHEQQYSFSTDRKEKFPKNSQRFRVRKGLTADKTRTHNLCIHVECAYTCATGTLLFLPHLPSFWPWQIRYVCNVFIKS